MKTAAGETTTFDSDSSDEAADRSQPRVDALVVVWCRDDADRIGEVLLVPAPAESSASASAASKWVLGRGNSLDPRGERLDPMRQRPGENRATTPFESARLSRVQMIIEHHPDGGLWLENVGKRRLFVRGRQIGPGRARAVAGDLVEIDDHSVFLCTRRPAKMAPLRAGQGDLRLLPAFGEADGFGYVGESPEAWRFREELAAVGSRREHVLVLGESGVGKELACQAIHGLSERAGRRLVTRSAATVPAGIIDAELFGNAANYPNAGMSERHGLVGEADRSTLYLDEIGELSPELQTHLLRLLDGGDYQRLGDARPRTADLRLLAATNRPVGQLRADLAARFAFHVHAAGLHERREDIPLLVKHLLRRVGTTTPSKELIVALLNHLYTTNVRELSNVLFRAALESSGPVAELTAGARLMLGLTSHASYPSDGVGPSNLGAAPVSASIGRRPEDVTQDEILEALARNDGVRERAWRDLGLGSRYVLKRLLQKYGIRDLAPSSHAPGADANESSDDAM